MKSNVLCKKEGYVTIPILNAAACCPFVLYLPMPLSPHADPFISKPIPIEASDRAIFAHPRCSLQEIIYLWK